MLNLLALLVAAAPAHAQDAPSAPTTTLDVEEPAPPAKGTRNFLMETNVRGRYLILPKSILDIWYEDHADGGTIPERPNVAAYSLGVEFVIKDKQANGIFYLEYLQPLIDDGYWDDREEPPDDADGSWLRANKFGIVGLGANYAYEIKANNWFSFLVGGGLGMGVVLGEIQEWRPADEETMCNFPEPAYTRYDDCDADKTVEVPPVIPFLDVNFGPKFNFGDRASLRIEGGLHDLPYFGGAFGAVF